MDSAVEVGDRLGQATLDLVRVPSVTGQEGPLADRVEGELRGLPGWRVLRHRNSVAAWWAGGDDGDARPRILLAGHLDTVPTFLDTAARREGDRVYGCGASDMKGSLALMLELARVWSGRTWAGRAPAAPCHPTLVFYSGEEGPIAGNELVPLLEAAGGDLPRPAFAICLEPTDGTLHLGCGGSMHADILVPGHKAHAARPWQGVNAVTAAWPLLKALHERAPRDVDVQGLTWREVLTVTQAEAGAGLNVVPDAFRVHVNGRFAPGRTAGDLLRELADLAGPQARVVLTDEAPSGRVCTDNPWYRRLQDVTGAPVLAKQAWTDVAQLGARGIDAVNYGPGRTDQAHQRGEFIEVPALVRGWRALEAFFGCDSVAP